MIDQPGGGRAERHAALGMVIELGLRHRQAALLLDELQAFRAVTAAAREDDADGLLLLVLREGREQRVDRAAMLARRRRPRDQQTAVADP
jgi:hypothetical protein